VQISGRRVGFLLTLPFFATVGDLLKEVHALHQRRINPDIFFAWEEHGRSIFFASLLS
jgi:hypothetical protein